MGTKGTTSYRIGDQNALYYITIATIGWVDIFIRRRYKDIIIESLIYSFDLHPDFIGTLHF